MKTLHTKGRPIIVIIEPYMTSYADESKGIDMAYISWTTYRCPGCREKLDRHFGGQEVGQRLGPLTIQCQRCHEVITTGKKEWDDLTPKEKRGYLAPTLDIVLVSGGVLFIIMLAIRGIGALVAFTAAGILLLIYSSVPISKLFEIRKSKRRTESAKERDEQFTATLDAEDEEEAKPSAKDKEYGGIGWHAVWFIPAALFVLFTTEHHAIPFAWTVLKLFFKRWMWAGLFTPCSPLVLSILYVSVVWPAQGLLMAAAFLREPSQGRRQIYLALVCLAVVLALPLVTDTLVWGSFPFTYDNQGYGRIRFIPFIPWPSGGYGAL